MSRGLNVPTVNIAVVALSCLLGMQLLPSEPVSNISERHF